jgi:aerobic carbon-monoxide dehydrogenase large subunit
MASTTFAAAQPATGVSNGAVSNGRLEDERLLTGFGRYVADLKMPGVAHAVMVRSPHAHADILAIDVAAARASPGVIAVYTAADLAADGVGALPCGVDQKRADGQKAHQSQRPLMVGVGGRVRMVAEPVAMILADSPRAAQDAAELVSVDYKERAVVTTTVAAQQAGAASVWTEAADNIAYLWSKGDAAKADAALATAAHVVHLTSHVSRVNANSLEPRGVLALVDDTGRIVVHASHQGPWGLRAGLAGMLKLPADKIRIIAGDIGGSFGMKTGVSPEDVLVPWAARRSGRPVRWIAERVEGFMTDDHGRDVQVDARMALDQAGRILAIKANLDINIGAYLSGRSSGLLNNIGGISGVYTIGTVAVAIQAVFTNTQPTAPYRGAGRPEATYVVERLIDLAAAKMGVDAFELRQRNLIPASAMPYNTGFQFTYDCGEFAENMKAAAELSDLAGLPGRRTEAAARGKLRGVGFANPIEVAGGPFTKPGRDTASIRVASDGTVTVNVGVMSTGQGLETSMSRLVAERLGVPLTAVRYQQGDTDQLGHGRGSGGSSATGVGGAVVAQSADKVIVTAKTLAGDLLEAAPADIALAGGRFSIVGTDRSVGWAEVARAAEAKHEAGLHELADWQPESVTFPNGCHVCEVEVDPVTGEVAVVSYTVVEDIGRVLNPALAEGQIHGGIAMGVGQALAERMVYDPNSGQLLSASFMDYTMPRADDLPQIKFAAREVLTKVNVLGVKGVGEAGTVGSLVATINAVCNALAPLGIRHIEMPLTPDRVWAAIQAAKA